MKSLVVPVSLILALVSALPSARAQAPPLDWIDPTTGHRVIRLSGDVGGSNLYFHQNAYTPKGEKFIFTTSAGIAAFAASPIFASTAAADSRIYGFGSLSTAISAGTAAGPICPRASPAPRRTSGSASPSVAIKDDIALAVGDLICPRATAAVLRTSGLASPRAVIRIGSTADPDPVRPIRPRASVAPWRTPRSGSCRAVINAGTASAVDGWIQLRG